MILNKFLNQKHLLKAQVFCTHKMTKVILIYKDKNFIFVIFQIIISSLKYFNNDQIFTNISFKKSF